MGFFGKSDTTVSDKRLALFLIVLASTAVLVMIYHFITGHCCRRARPRPRSLPDVSDHIERPTSMENSVVHLIPVHKYKKDVELLGYDIMCSICLSEFEEDEELRILPECMHGFHKSCIDMWLYSHTSCPFCRGDATPSPNVTPRMIEQGSENVSEV